MGMARGETIDGEEMTMKGHIWETEAGIGALLVPLVCRPEFNCRRKRRMYCPASEIPVFSQKDRAQKRRIPGGVNWRKKDAARLVYSDNERFYLKQGGRLSPDPHTVAHIHVHTHHMCMHARTRVRTHTHKHKKGDKEESQTLEQKPKEENLFLGRRKGGSDHEVSDPGQVLCLWLFTQFILHLGR